MRKIGLLATTLLCGIATPAWSAEDAQAAPAEDASAADEPTVGLQDIIVTAQRREETLQNAAIAINVIGSDDLTRNGITSPLQLGTLVPSLTVAGNGASNTIFFVRGAGNFNSDFADPSIAFNYDGVYIGRLTSNAGLMYDLERIEVLKGPQGTLYGRNATSGAINVIPARPRLGETSGFVNATYGNHDALLLQGAANLAMGENGALRISGNYSKHDGYLTDGTSDDKTTGLRFQMMAELTPDLTVRVAGDYTHAGGEGGGASYLLTYAFNPATSHYVFTPSGFDRSVGLFDPAAQAYRRTLFGATPRRNLGPIDPLVFLDNTTYGANAEIAWDAGIGTLTVIPAYRFTRLDNSTAVFAGTALRDQNSDQWSVEARFDGDRIGIFDYLVGGYFFDESVAGDVTIAQDSLDVFQDYASNTKSTAFFGRLTANISDRLRLVGGIRHTHDKKTFDAVSQVNLIRCVLAPPTPCPNAPVAAVVDNPQDLPYPVGAPNNFAGAPVGNTGAVSVLLVTPVSSGLKTNKATYRAAIEFDVAEKSLFYASYETGFRSGGFSVAFGRESYAPEFITAYSIGLKNRLFDNRLQLNAEAFLWKYRDQQVIHTGIDGRGAQAQFTENVGRSTNKGIEVETRFLATPTITLSANVLYLKAKYDSFIYQQPVGPGPAAVIPPLSGCAVARSTAVANAWDVDCSGKPSYNAPKWTVNLGAEQIIPLGDYQLSLAADTQFRSKRYVGFEYLPFQLVKSTWQTNAQVTFSTEDRRWSIGAFVRNLENNRQLTNTIILPAGSLVTALSGPPRTYGVTASAKF